MTFFRPGRLRNLAACVVFGAGLFGHLFAQTPVQPPAQQPPAQPPQQAPPQQKKANPFEVVPQAPEQTTPKPVTPAPETLNPDRPPTDNIELIEFRGARR